MVELPVFVMITAPNIQARSHQQINRNRELPAPMRRVQDEAGMGRRVFIGSLIIVLFYSCQHSVSFSICGMAECRYVAYRIDDDPHLII